MAQFARPDSDVATGAWSATPLWSKIDEGSPGDDTVITSANNTAPDNADFTTTSVTDPASSASHILRAAWSKNATGGHAITAVLELWQGVPGTGALVATLSVAGLGATEQEDSYTLSAAEADAITDYAALHLRLSRQGETGGNPNGRRSLVVDFADLEVPDAPASATADLAAVLPALTGGFDTGVAVNGDMAASLPVLAVALDTGVTVTADFAGSLPLITAAFDVGASEARAVDLAATLPLPAASADAGVIVAGDLSASLPGLTATAGVTVLVTGDMSVVLPALAASMEIGGSELVASGRTIVTRLRLRI